MATHRNGTHVGVYLSAHHLQLLDTLRLQANATRSEILRELLEHEALAKRLTTPQALVRARRGLQGRRPATPHVRGLVQH